jgi:hypothetical protein
MERSKEKFESAIWTICYQNRPLNYSFRARSRIGSKTSKREASLKAEAELNMKRLIDLSLECTICRNQDKDILNGVQINISSETETEIRSSHIIW